MKQRFDEAMMDDKTCAPRDVHIEHDDIELDDDILDCFDKRWKHSRWDQYEFKGLLSGSANEDLYTAMLAEGPHTREYEENLRLLKERGIRISWDEFDLYALMNYLSIPGILGNDKDEENMDLYNDKTFGDIDVSDPSLGYDKDEENVDLYNDKTFGDIYVSDPNRDEENMDLYNDETFGKYIDVSDPSLSNESQLTSLFSSSLSLSATRDGLMNEPKHDQLHKTTDTCQSWLVDLERELGLLWGSNDDNPKFPEPNNTFGHHGSFSEELYTTKPVRGPHTRELEKEAERIAKEIEDEDTQDLHVAEERGIHIDDKFDLDEETKYASVSRLVANSGSGEKGVNVDLASVSRLVANSGSGEKRANVDLHNDETFGDDSDLLRYDYSLY